MYNFDEITNNYNLYDAVIESFTYNLQNKEGESECIIRLNVRDKSDNWMLLTLKCSNITHIKFIELNTSNSVISEYSFEVVENGYKIDLSPNSFDGQNDYERSGFYIKCSVVELLTY